MRFEGKRQDVQIVLLFMLCKDSINLLNKSKDDNFISIPAYLYREYGSNWVHIIWLGVVEALSNLLNRSYFKKAKLPSIPFLFKVFSLYLLLLVGDGVHLPHLVTCTSGLPLMILKSATSEFEELGECTGQKWKKNYRIQVLKVGKSGGRCK